MRADKNTLHHYLQELKPVLSEKHILILGFFGSYARGENGVYSDIDIAIKKDENYLAQMSAYDYFNDVAFLKNMVLKKFHRNVDIFDVDSNSSFKNDILKDLVHV